METSPTEFSQEDYDREKKLQIALREAKEERGYRPTGNDRKRIISMYYGEGYVPHTDVAEQVTKDLNAELRKQAQKDLRRSQGVMPCEDTQEAPTDTEEESPSTTSPRSKHPLLDLVARIPPNLPSFSETALYTHAGAFCDSREEHPYGIAHTAFIQFISAPFKKTLGDEAEIIAENAFAKALEAFDRTYPALFQTFAAKAMKNALINACRGKRTEEWDDEAEWEALGVLPKELDDPTEVPTDTFDPTASEALENLEPTVTETLDIKLAYKALNLLSEDRRSALIDHFANVEDEVIATRFGVKKELVRQWRSRDLKKLRESVTNANECVSNTTARTTTKEGE